MRLADTVNNNSNIYFEKSTVVQSPALLCKYEMPYFSLKSQL